MCDVWQVYRGNEAVAALALALSPRIARERWLQSALVRHFPEAVSVLRVRILEYWNLICFLYTKLNIKNEIWFEKR